MNNDEMIERLIAIEQRSKSNTKRIDKLEEVNKTLTQLTIAVKEMVVKQSDMKESIDTLDKKFDELDTRTDSIELKPAKRWEGYVEKAIYAAIAIFVGYLLAMVGVK